jgi:hypothetical protein
LTAGRTITDWLPGADSSSRSAHSGQRLPFRVSMMTIGESASSDRPMSVMAGASESARSAAGIQSRSAAPGLKPSARLSSAASSGTPIRFFGSPSGVKWIRRRVREPGSATVK